MQTYRHREFVNKIILYPSRQHGLVDFEEFAKIAIPETWVKPVPIQYGVEDWRQAETDPALLHSDSEWLWFNEQDFFVRDWDKFYEDIEKAMKHADVIGWWNPTHFPYVHPSCLFIKREVFEKTSKDFRAHPEINGCDHFAMITRDAVQAGAKIVTLQDLGYKDWEDATHLGGLTYVYQDWKGDGTDTFGVRSPEMFFVYNFMARQADTLQDPKFLGLSQDIEVEMMNRFDFHIDLRNNKWTSFFT